MDCVVVYFVNVEIVFYFGDVFGDDVVGDVLDFFGG